MLTDKGLLFQSPCINYIFISSESFSAKICFENLITIHLNRSPLHFNALINYDLNFLEIQHQSSGKQHN